MLLCSKTQGSIKPGAYKICKILRKIWIASDNFIFCCCVGVALGRQDIIFLCAISLLQKPIQKPLLAFQ